MDIMTRDPRMQQDHRDTHQKSKLLEECRRVDQRGKPKKQGVHEDPIADQVLNPVINGGTTTDRIFECGGVEWVNACFSGEMSCEGGGYHVCGGMLHKQRLQRN